MVMLIELWKIYSWVTYLLIPVVFVFLLYRNFRSKKKKSVLDLMSDAYHWRSPQEDEPKPRKPRKPGQLADFDN